MLYLFKHFLSLVEKLFYLILYCIYMEKRMHTSISFLGKTRVPASPPEGRGDVTEVQTDVKFE